VCILHHWFMPPLMKLATSLEDNVQAATATGLLNHVDSFMEHGRRGIQMMLPYMSEAEIAEDDGSRFLPNVQTCCGVFQERLCSRWIVEKQIARSGEAAELRRGKMLASVACCK
jgi:hypothetical protein